MVAGALCAALLLVSVPGPISIAPATRASAPLGLVWMGPPAADSGRAWRDLFAHADQWAPTRSLVDGLLYADHQLSRQFTDAELRGQFARIRQWNLKLQLEVGAIKEWGPTGAQTFQAQRPAWDRFIRLGASIHSIAMDEPLLCTRHYLKKPDEHAIEETARFIELVRRAYPRVLIGDVETYPSIPLADHLWWLDALQKRLASRGVRGLDFYRLDVNWVEFNVFGRGGWPEVRKLQEACASRGLPFSLIYWASDYPSMKAKSMADDSTWYVSTMRQGYDYAMVDGRPDQFVIESWVGAPAATVPDSAEFTFTRSVRDFARRFAVPRRP